MPAIQEYFYGLFFFGHIALQSSLSLRCHRALIYIDTVEDFDETFVVASFVYHFKSTSVGWTS